MLSFALYAAVVSSPPIAAPSLVGAWTVKVQFTTGAFASVKDLELMMVFNQGGTMVESSNYDGAPPVPPAYGIWRKTGKNKFESKYVFYNTKAPSKFEDISGGGGWMPAGKGILIEKITLAPKGDTYKSTITLKMFDQKGKPAGEVWKGACSGVRMKF